MSLLSEKNTFLDSVISLWSRSTLPERTGFYEVAPHIKRFWNSLEVLDYEGVVTPVVDYSFFDSMVLGIDSRETTSTTTQQGASLLESLLRSISVHTSFESTDVNIVPGQIIPVDSSMAEMGYLSSLLVILFNKGIEGDPQVEYIVNSMASFFQGWSVEIDDNGNPITANII